MKIAVLGSGGREHAIAWKLAQVNPPEDIFVIPGNGGTRKNVDIKPTEMEELKYFCLESKVELLIVGPEDPLAAGIVDYFQDTPIKVFGPDQKAAALEASKIHAKRFMKKHGVATGDFWLLEDGDDIEAVIEQLSGHVVIKYDGLAAGKGVFVCSSITKAEQALEEIKNRYGETAPFLIEEKLSGWELSVIAFTDGQSIKMLLPSQDHKPVYEGDKGPNTGGMGAYCPVPACTSELMERIQNEIVEPTLRGIRNEQLNYKGVIYFGLMITAEGPRLLEYNVRFGDPETEVILPSLKSNLLDLILACLNGTLDQCLVEFHPGFFVDVVLASGGYPGSYATGKPIIGLDRINPNTLIFHAGTKYVDGQLLSSGGRVLNVVGHGNDLNTAIEGVYSEVQKIHFENMYYRKDIGRKGLKS